MSCIRLKTVENCIVKTPEIFSINKTWTKLPLSYELEGQNVMDTNGFDDNENCNNIHINIQLYSSNLTNIMIAFGNTDTLNIIDVLSPKCSGCPYIVDTSINTIIENNTKIYYLWFSSDKTTEISIQNIAITMTTK